MITDKLRDTIRTATKTYEDLRNPYNDREICHIAEEELQAIADRIDEEHEKATSDFWLSSDAVSATDENMAEYGWIRLPMDADGVPIRVGDRLDYDYGDDLRGTRTVEAIILTDRWDFELSGEEGDTRDVADMGDFFRCNRHAQPDTWEKIMDDATMPPGAYVDSHSCACDGTGCEVTEAMAVDLVKRCMKLAGK